MKLIRAWSVKSIENLGKLAADPAKKIADDLQKYTDSDNGEVQQLFEQASTTGNRTAGLLAQQIIAEDQFDGCE